MSNIRKLSAFRQLSLNCSPTTAEQRRKSFKKQFSEDLPDLKSNWLDPSLKISLNTKAGRNLDRPPQIKLAWEEDLEELKAEDAVIIKKCREVRRASTGRLSRKTSLEKDSILHSKQELAERLRQSVREKDQENAKQKEHEKRNLKIFLAHNSVDHKGTFTNDSEQHEEKPQGRPKLIQPLITNDADVSAKKLFQIRRSKSKINLHEIAYSPTRYNMARNDTVVVVPMIDTEAATQASNLEDADTTRSCSEFEEVLKPIDSVIIRPATAASKRDKFQKRTNSAFNATIKDVPRPTLIRSSSAPTNGKSKFVATKRKIKSAKRVQIKNAVLSDKSEGGVSNKENPKSQKELNRTTAVNGSDVVTMVSLVSPAGSDGEEEVVEDKSNRNGGAREEVPKGFPLRKIVKTGKHLQEGEQLKVGFSL